MIDFTWCCELERMQNSPAHSIGIEDQNRSHEQCPQGIYQACERIQQAWFLDNVIRDKDDAGPQKKQGAGVAFQLGCALEIDPCWIEFFAQNP